jgi:exocyst complex component 5
MARFTNTVLIKLAQSNTTVRRDMENKTKEAIKRMEEKSSTVIQRTIEVILNWVTKLLAAQKKQDFRPRDNELTGSHSGPGYLESLQTPTCAAICTFLDRTLHTTSQALDGHNLEMFSTELSVCVRDLLFEHFKKFQVDATGGLMVTKDISRYTSTLKEWPARKEVDTSLEILSEIENLFIIGPEALKERSRTLQTGGLGRGLERADFRAFVSRRDDAGSVGIQSVLAGL